MVLTKHQKKVLSAQTPVSRYSRIPTQRLGMKKNAIDSVNTDVFATFLEVLELMADPDYAQIFRGRIKKKRDRIWTATREIRNYIKSLDLAN